MATANGSLGTALVAFQNNAPSIPKTKTVRVQTKQGGSYTFDYAPLDSILEAVRPLLVDAGLAVSQMLSSTDAGMPSLRTVLMHISGDKLEAEFPLPVQGGMSPQEIGSLISYMRRYSIVSLLGLATETDDDGNHASGNTVEQAEEKTQFVPPTQAQASEAQRKMIRALTGKLVKAGVLTEEQAETLTSAADDPSTSKAAASKAIERLKEKEAEVEAQAAA